MSRPRQWGTVLATLAAIATVVSPAFFSVSHEQALTNVILGELAALAIGYTAYRYANGRDPVRAVVFGAALCGGILAASPLVLGFGGAGTTETLLGGGVVTIGGLGAFLTTVLRGNDNRSHDLA